MTSTKSMESRLSVVESEMAGNAQYMERFDGSMQKISDVLVGVKEILAVHEERHKKQDDFNKTLGEVLKSHAESDENEFAHVRNNLSQVSASLEMKMDTMKKDIIGQVDSLRKDVEIKISNFEKLKWTVTGAGIVVLMVLARMGYHFPSLGSLIGAE